MFKHRMILCVSGVIIFTIIIGGNIIVSSQNNQNRTEISSPSGVKHRPENLRVPQNVENPNNKYFPQDIPEDVTYRQMFKHIKELNQKADGDERQKGRDGRKFRNLYKDMASLQDKQARLLDRIADETNRELDKLDERAKQIIDQIRSQTPNRRIERGQKPPLPPQELFDLAQRRKDVTLRAINNLRQNLGNAEFVRFNSFVNERVKTGIKKKGDGTTIQRGGRQR